jgi:methionyl-tRNA formyltransferase
MLRIVFFGSSESVFSNRHFDALLQTPCQTVAVVDVPPDKRVSTNTRTAAGAENFVARAQEHDIPAYEPRSPNTPAFVEAVRAQAPDVFIAVGYMNLLKADILAVPRLVAANFHASLLPAYRGKHPVFWALRSGEKWSGLTVHVMDAHFDTGDILYQVRVRTRKKDTVGALYDRIMDASVLLVARLIEDAENGKLIRTPQTNAGVSYYSSTQEKDFRLNWSCDAEQLRRWMQTSPGQCFAGIGGQRVYFHDAERVPNLNRDAPGVLSRIARSSVVIAAAGGAVRIKRAHIAGEQEKNAAQLFRELGLRQGMNVEP